MADGSAGMSDEEFNKRLSDFKKIFRIYDADPNGDDPDSGKLSSTEVPRAMRAAGICLTEAVASDIECDIDCDYESLCDENLFLQLIKKHYKEPPGREELMKAFSALNDGKIKISTDDLIHSLAVIGPKKDRLTDEEKEHLRKVVDKKGTGQVNLKGLGKYMTTSVIPDSKIKASDSPIKK